MMFDPSHMNGRQLFGTIQMLGVMNSLRTGDPTVDAILAMLLPVLLSMILNWLEKQKQHLFNMLKGPTLLKPTYYRTIAFSAASKGGVLGASSSVGDDDNYNNFLVKAIQLYIHSCCHLRFDDADLKLTTIGNTRVMNDEDQIISTNRRGKATSTADMLKQCEIIKQPVRQRWHTVGTFQGEAVRVWFEESKSNKSGKDNSDNAGGDSSSKSLKIRMESHGKTSIDSFVDTAYDWYKNELKKLDNTNRYFYDLTSVNTSGRMTPVYTRYLLGEEKSFDNLFCKEQTDSLIEMVDKFQKKQGKYGIPGFPHKLGILLHGVPGTGKTSLIKALAKYTRRQVVNVSLNRIQTNQALMAVLFNKVCTVSGLQNSVKLGQEDVIFVLEDVDASSNVVKKRKKKKKAKNRESIPPVEDAPPTASPSGTGSVQPGTTTTVPRSAAVRRPLLRTTPDQLGLAGMLNALDGVVDTPGRIIIMTTNHPEMLDPALVRPGRIDKSIELGYMKCSDAIAMMEHYYNATLSMEDKSAMEDLLVTSETTPALQVTPAELEQLIMREDLVGGVIDALGELKRKREILAQDGDSDSEEEDNEDFL